MRHGPDRGAARLRARRWPGRELDDRPLAELSYTAFDTDSTGLDPLGGDELSRSARRRSSCASPVLDTLLSAIAHPEEPEHLLEGMAARSG